MDLTRDQLELIILLCLVYVSWGLTDSIQAPFYPIEAEEKGATSSEYGLVFGIIHLAMFLAGPVFGHYMHRLGVKHVFIFGVLGTAFCACFFGFLGYFPTKWSFLGTSYGLRIVEGVAEAGAWSSVLTIIGGVYKDRVTSVYSLTQAAFGFAEILGPSVGGIMFEVGDFIFPFEFSGGLCLLVGVLTIWRLPRLVNQEILESSTSTPAHSSISSLKEMISDPGVVLALTGTVFGAVCQGFIETFLESYLALFGLSVSQIGVSFLAMSVPYMLATPLWGWLADTNLLPELISPAGNLLILGSLVLIGPASYTTLPPDFLLTEVGLGILGVGTAATLTATFCLAQKHALNAAHCTPEEGHSVISGLWTSAFAFGNFLGPTVGGPLVDWLGFTGTTPVLQAWAGVMLLTDIWVLLTRGCSQGQGELQLRNKGGSERDLYQRLE